MNIIPISEMNGIPFRVVSIWFRENKPEDLLAHYNSKSTLEEPHADPIWAPMGRKQCPQCAGSGKLALFTSVEDCATCAGAGCYYEST